MDAALIILLIVNGIVCISSLVLALKSNKETMAIYIQCQILQKRIDSIFTDIPPI